MFTNLIASQEMSAYNCHFENALPVVKTKEQFNSLFMSLEDYVKESEESKNAHAITRLFLIRHAQSVANQEKIIAGQTVDAPLTEAGVLQAENAAKILVRQVDHFSGIYCTPLQRTAQTIDAINRIWFEQKNKVLAHPIVVKELIEKHCGTLEGASAEEYEPFKQKENQDFSLFKTFKEKFSYKMVDEEEYESFLNVFERAIPALTKIGQHHIGKDVLICTHVAVMRSLILGLLASKPDPVDLELRSFDLPNSAILILEFDKETKKLSVKATNDLTFNR